MATKVNPLKFARLSRFPALLATIVLAHAAAFQGDTVLPDPAGEIRIVRLENQTLLLRAVKGPYSTHGQEISKLMQAAKSMELRLGRAVGIYPDDPDVVGAAETRWKIGFALKNTAAPPPDLKEPFAIVELGETEAAVLTSTLKDSARDGLRMLAWLPLSGYVQIAPTRIEYADLSGGPNSSLRIVVPVRKRGQRP